jgi:hypothetical protein
MPAMKSVKDGHKKVNRKRGPIKKRTKRLDRGKALREMTRSAYEFGKPFVEKAYEVGKPLVQDKMRDMYTRGLKYGQDLGESYRVPKVTNNPSWVDLRKSLNEKVFEMGVTDKEIDIGIYLRGVEAFLKKYKGISFSKAEIKQAGHTLMGKDIGSAMEKYMETALKKGITEKTIIEIFEYLFNHKISPESDTEIEMDASDQGFSEVKENKRLEALKKKMRGLERKADIASKALDNAANPGEKRRFTIELNVALKEIYKLIASLADSGGGVSDMIMREAARLLGKYTTLVSKTKDDEGRLMKNHDEIDPDIKQKFNDFSRASQKKNKKKKKKKKTRKHRKHRR